MNRKEIDLSIMEKVLLANGKFTTELHMNVCEWTLFSPKVGDILTTLNGFKVKVIDTLHHSSSNLGIIRLEQVN